MNAQDWTPTPWFREYRQQPDGSYATEVFCAEGKTIADCAWYPTPLDSLAGKIGSYRMGNARRIVECVNACANIPNPAAIADVVAALDGILLEMSAMERRVIADKVEDACQALASLRGEA